MGEFDRITVPIEMPKMQNHWYLPSQAPSQVPLIDCSLLFGNHPEEKKSLQKALHGSGAFYLKKFDFDIALAESLIQESKLFFESGELEKKKMICAEPPPRGFTPLKSENLAKLLSVGDYPDLCQKYSWAQQENVYPSEAFRIAWQSYYEAIGRLAAELVRQLCWILGESQNTDWDLLVHGENTLRHLHYPDLTDKQELSMAPHTDLGSITLLYQTPCPNGHVALEVQTEDGFVGVPPIKDTLVVSCGDTLAHITNGRVRATRHRVVHSSKEGAQRTSTICFFLPDRSFNLKKYHGSRFSELVSDEVSTFGELIDKDRKEYLKKEFS